MIATRFEVLTWRETADFSTSLRSGRNDGISMGRDMVDFAEISKMSSMEGVPGHVS
jgi:hypothetical protein